MEASPMRCLWSDRPAAEGGSTGAARARAYYIVVTGAEIYNETKTARRTGYTQPIISATRTRRCLAHNDKAVGRSRRLIGTARRGWAGRAVRGGRQIISLTVPNDNEVGKRTRGGCGSALGGKVDAVRGGGRSEGHGECGGSQEQHSKILHSGRLASMVHLGDYNIGSAGTRIPSALGCGRFKTLATTSQA